MFTMTDLPKRRRGSVRFAPYYKAQFYRPLDFSWQDVQQQFPTADEARAAFPPGKRCRLMLVTERGRTPVDGSDTGGAPW
jgi:hypothetical protein